MLCLSLVVMRCQPLRRALCFYLDFALNLSR
ncbi:acetyltransferase [Vibrio cholerae]|nr:acetyltransferase [Vibrio cholerae]